MLSAPQISRALGIWHMQARVGDEINVHRATGQYAVSYGGLDAEFTGKFGLRSLLCVCQRPNGELMPQHTHP